MYTTMRGLNYVKYKKEEKRKKKKKKEKYTIVNSSQRFFSMSCWKLSYDEQTYTNNRGTIHNKETQLLAYADDIDIVGRSQSAV
jgi:DNA gyrase/topoisomerase IV subunit A